MSDLTAKFTALEDQLATQAATTDALVDTVEEQLTALFNELDTVIVNNAANTKAILAALGQTAACFPCPTPSIVVPPLDTTVRTINTDKCKRSHAMIAAIASILTAFDTLQSFDVIGSFNVINDAIGEVVGAIAAGDTLPLPSFPEAVQIAGTYVSYAGERLFSGVSLMDQFGPLESDLVDPIYNATTAEAAQEAYNSSIEASDASTAAKFLFKAVPYHALWSYYLDTTSTPDLGAFSGTDCGLAPGSCFTLVSASFTSNVPSAGESVQGAFASFTPGTSLTTTSATYTFTPAMIYDGDLFGWGWRVVSGSNVNCQYRAGNHASATSLTNEGPHSAGATVFPFATHTGMFLFYSGSGSNFTIELCAP